MRILVKLMGMLGVGLSVLNIDELGVWFLIPWLISWLIYDYHFEL